MSENLTSNQSSYEYLAIVGEYHKGNVKMICSCVCGLLEVQVGEYGIPGLTGISNWLDELLSRYVG